MQDQSIDLFTDNLKFERKYLMLRIGCEKAV